MNADATTPRVLARGQRCIWHDPLHIFYFDWMRAWRWVSDTSELVALATPFHPVLRSPQITLDEAVTAKVHYFSVFSAQVRVVAVELRPFTRCLCFA
jgi:hypothetical protein